MKALLVVDMLYDFIDPNGALYVGEVTKELVPEVKARVEKYRSEGWLVIYTCDRHLDDDMEFNLFPPHSVKGSGGDEIIAELAPRPGERVIEKRRFSAFVGTDLDLMLRDKEIKELELVGVVTNICILYTAAMAQMYGYKVTVPVKAVASFDLEAHHFALKEMEKTLGIRLI